MDKQEGKIVEVIGVENKTGNRLDDSVGVEEKEYTLNDILNLCNKRFDEMDKKWDKLFEKMDKLNAMLDDMISDIKGFNNDMKRGNEKWKREADKLKKSIEVEPKQVSVCGGSNISKNNEGRVDKVDVYKRQYIYIVTLHNPCPNMIT